MKEIGDTISFIILNGLLDYFLKTLRQAGESKLEFLEFLKFQEFRFNLLKRLSLIKLAALTKLTNFLEVLHTRLKLRPAGSSSCI